MAGKKKLLIFGHAPLPQEHPNAVGLIRHLGRWVLDQAKALSEYSDYEVTLVTLVKGAKVDFENQYGSLRVIYLKAQPKLRERTGYVWDILRLRKLAKEVSPDIVHAHGTEDAYGLAALTLSVPKVLTVQGLYHDVNSKSPAGFLSPAYVIQRLESLVLKRFDRAIVKSLHVKQVTENFFPHLTLEVIPNTLNDAFLGNHATDKNTFKLAFVGTIIKRKGFHHIREALVNIQKERSLELHVFGNGPDKTFVNHEVDLIRRAGHQVVLHGSVDAKTLAKELSSTNLLIAPSYAETFGNQVIEGLLRCCHCIVSDHTGMAENIRKYGGGTVVPQRDAEHLSDIITEQTAQPVSESEKRVRTRVREKVIDTLGPQNIATQLSHYYHQVLAVV